MANQQYGNNPAQQTGKTSADQKSGQNQPNKTQDANRTGGSQSGTTGSKSGSTGSTGSKI